MGFFRSWVDGEGKRGWGDGEIRSLPFLVIYNNDPPSGSTFTILDYPILPTDTQLCFRKDTWLANTLPRKPYLVALGLELEGRRVVLGGGVCSTRFLLPPSPNFFFPLSSSFFP